MKDKEKSCKNAEKGLIAMAGATSETPTGLQDAALCALGNMGTATATDHLLDSLEKSSDEDAGELSELIRNVSASQTSVAALRYAAAGNKRFSSDKTRLVAIQALGLFQDRQTRDLMESLAKDANASIRIAAAAVLADEDTDVED